MHLMQSKGDFLVLHLSELVRVAFMAATSDADALRLEGLRTLEVMKRSLCCCSSVDLFTLEWSLTNFTWAIMLVARGQACSPSLPDGNTINGFEPDLATSSCCCEPSSLPCKLKEKEKDFSSNSVSNQRNGWMISVQHFHTRDSTFSFLATNFQLRFCACEALAFYVSVLACCAGVPGSKPVFCLCFFSNKVRTRLNWISLYSTIRM